MHYNYYFKNLKKNIFLVNFYLTNKSDIFYTLLVKIPNVKNYYINLSNEYENNITVSKTEYKNMFEKIIYQKIFYNINAFEDLLIEVMLEDNDIDYNNNNNSDKDINYNDIDKDIKHNDSDSNDIDSNNSANSNNSDNTNNTTDFLRFTININKLINDNIIKTDIFTEDNNIYINIDKFIILIEEYDRHKIILHDYLYPLSSYDYRSNIINKCLNKLYIVHNELNMIHGDFKLNNILISKIDAQISFIDLEFSVFFNNTNEKSVKEIKLINYYLSLYDDYKLTFSFLKLFDIFIFTISLFVSSSMEYNHYFKYKMEEDIERNIMKNTPYSDYYIYFFITFIKIYDYFIKKNIYSYNHIIYYDMCRFKNIYDIYFLNNYFYDNYMFRNKLIEFEAYIEQIFEEIMNINNEYK